MMREKLSFISLKQCFINSRRQQVGFLLSHYYSA